MWGHDTGVYDGADNVYNIPVSAPVTMCDACRYMGIPNVCVVRWFPATQDRAYLEDFRKARRFSWVACGDHRWATKYQLADGCLAAMKDFPNMTGMDFDDFFNAAAPNEVQNCSDGAQEVSPGCFTLEEMEDYRRRLAGLGRPRCPEIKLVLYSGQLDKLIKPAIDRVDTVLFWTWSGSDLARLRGNFAKYRRIAPGKPTLLGIYMWDFGGRKPIGMDYMKHQLGIALEFFREGKIEGLVFHCTPLVNKNIGAVEYCRKWLDRHAGETRR